MSTHLAVLLGVTACILVMARPAVSGEADPSVPGQAKTGSNSAAVPDAGLKIYIDPQTGAIRRDPAPGTVPLELSPELKDAFSTSHEGLTEVPSTVPGGGFKLDLKGRFQSPLVGTIDADGKLKMQHLGEPAESGSKK
jgi:hypothetical protein